MAVREQAVLRSGRLAGRPQAHRAPLRRDGFYQAEVVKDEVRPEPPDGVALEVQVSEGKQTHVGKLDIEGLEALPAADREAALEELPLATGAVFREEDWAATKRLLADRLRNRGYAKAAVEGRALVDVKTQLANLTLIVAPGPPLPLRRRSRSRPSRARASRADVVWEQVRLAIHEGASVQRQR